MKIINCNHYFKIIIGFINNFNITISFTNYFKIMKTNFDLENINSDHYSYLYFAFTTTNHNYFKTSFKFLKTVNYLNLYLYIN